MNFIQSIFTSTPKPQVFIPPVGTRLISSNGEFGVVREVRRGKIICTRYTAQLSYVVEDADGDYVKVYEPGEKVRGVPGAVLTPGLGNDWHEAKTHYNWRPLPKGTLSLPDIFRSY
jgi:hypothetical protein